MDTNTPKIVLFKFSLKINVFFLFIYLCIFYVCVSVSGPPELELQVVVILLLWVLESLDHLRPPEGQQVPLAVQPSLQPLEVFFLQNEDLEGCFS